MKSNLGFNLTKLGSSSLLMEPYDNLDPLCPGPMIETISNSLFKTPVPKLYYDLNKILIIDEVYYDWLCMLSKACSIFQTKLIAINIKPSAAISLSSFINKKPPFETEVEMSN
ncbi:MAG: hypothetical protein RBR53_02105 [Desulforegulaceae bacterium]|nr:hypothetical protein [Desulforegulaceae bacterium]